MGTTALIRHGTEAGYRTERTRGNPCNRCLAAHRVYNSQFSAKGKAKGTKYKRDEIVDHLAGPAGQRPGRGRVPTVAATLIPGSKPLVTVPDSPVGESGGEDAGTNLGDRLADRMRSLLTRTDDNSPEYVSEDSTGYVSGNDEMFDEPGPGWESADDTDYIINAAGLRKIEENMGTYLSVVGITVEMIDPYCGPILAENFDTIVKRWSKVVANYPKAAELFMDAKGGHIMSWIGALQATWPVLYAVYQHHLAHTVTVKDGKIFSKRDMPSANGVDATMPPQFDYSAT
jgi:hypothetical protein